MLSSIEDILWIMEYANCVRMKKSPYIMLLHFDHAKQFWTTAFGHFGFTIPRLHPTSWMQDLLMGSVFTEEQVPIAMKVHSINSRINEAGSGYVIRNDTAGFVEAGCCKHAYVEDPFISELLACREGLEAAAMLGIQKIILWTDCSLLVDFWKDGKEQRIIGAHRDESGAETF